MAPAVATAAPRPLSAEEHWHNAFKDVFPAEPDSKWHGWMGSWARFDEAENVLEEFPAIRVFRKDGDVITGPAIVLGGPEDVLTQRPDGNWARTADMGHVEKFTMSREHSMHWNGLWHPVYPADEDTGSLQVRLLTPFPGRQVFLLHALPTAERQAGAKNPPFFWANLVMVRAPDGGRRNVAAIYDGKTGEFQKLTYEREMPTIIDDVAMDIELRDCPFTAAPGAKLPEDPAAWLDPGEWRGTARLLHIGATEEEGLTVEEAPVSWSPPAQAPHLRLARLVDNMYAVVPRAVPPAAELPQEGLDVEVGGFLAADAFVRAVVHYAGGDGRLTTLRFEDYTRTG